VEARELADADARVRYVRHENNRGYGEALRTGIRTARHDAIFFTDGDRQFDLRELDRAWPLLADADVVAGYRVNRADSRLRLFIAWVYKTILRILFGMRVRDVDCAFKLFRRTVTAQVDPVSGGAFFSAEFLLRARSLGFTIAEVGVTHHPRVIGSAKGATPAVILRTFREMFSLWRSLPRDSKRPEGESQPEVRS
jgi:glycosyltransferase involved in cell wall biosynthesis